MVRIPRSEQGVGLSGQALPASTGDGYEAPGKALQSLGQGVTSFALAFDKQQNELADFEGRAKYQTFVNEVDRRRREADVNVTGDGRGHTDRLDADTDTAFQRFQAENSHLPERTQRRLQLQYGGDRNRFSSRSFRAEQDRIGPYYDEQGGNWFNTNIVPRLFETDPETGQPLTDRLTSVGRASAEIDRFLDGAPGMPPAVRERLRQDLAKKIYQLWQNDAGPDAAVERDRIVEQLRIERNAERDDESRAFGDRPTVTPGSDRRSETTGPRRAAIDVAREYVGTNERQHAQTLSAFFRRSSGQRLNPQETAWCAAFVNAALAASGGQGTDTLLARDFLKVGTATENPREGDIVVLSRGDPNGWQGHVGFYVGRDRRGNVLVLGGNQGNAVSVSPFPASQVLGYRTPPDGGTPIPGGGTAATTGDRPTRVAESGVIRSDANAVVTAQARTEDLVRRYIIDNQVEIERGAEQRRRRLDIDERQEEVALRKKTTHDGFRMLENLQGRRARDGLNPGVVSEPDPDKPELTREWIEEQRVLGLLTPTDANRLMRGLDPTIGRARISNPDVYRRLMDESRNTNSLPQVVADRALDMFHRDVITRQHYDAIVANVRRGASGNRIQTPPFVTDAFRELDRHIPLPTRNSSEADRTRYNETLSKLNDYVKRGLEAGNLDPEALNKYVTGLANTNRRDDIRSRMERLQRQPRPRFLSVDPQNATFDSVAEASTRLRQELDAVSAIATSDPAAMTAMAPRLAEINRQSGYLRELYQILIEDYKNTHNGESPPPPRASSPKAPGATQPPGGQGPQSPPAQQEPPATPAGPRKGTTNISPPPQGNPTDGVLTRGPRTFRRIVRDADGNIEGMIEEPLP